MDQTIGMLGELGEEIRKAGGRKKGGGGPGRTTTRITGGAHEGKNRAT